LPTPEVRAGFIWRHVTHGYIVPPVLA
jgi:hypothetical protein